MFFKLIIFFLFFFGTDNQKFKTKKLLHPILIFGISIFGASYHLCCNSSLPYFLVLLRHRRRIRAQAVAVCLLLRREIILPPPRRSLCNSSSLHSDSSAWWSWCSDSAAVVVASVMKLEQQWPNLTKISKSKVGNQFRSDKATIMKCNLHLKRKRMKNKWKKSIAAAIIVAGNPRKSGKYEDIFTKIPLLK